MGGNAWVTAYVEAATPLMERCGVPGVIVGLNRDGKSVYRQGFGYRDLEQRRAITANTVMGIASITKSFTCAAIMQLQEAGKLTVHDPVLAYLPEFRTPAQAYTERMTIHHFMTHTSGLPVLPTDYLAIKWLADGDIRSENHPIHRQIRKDDQKWINTYEDFMEVISKTDFALLGPPGAQFNYSNDAYTLLGAIIERVSGMLYEEYIKAHILEPAGMLNSSFALSDLPRYQEVTTIYHLREKDGEKEIYADPNWEDTQVVMASGHLNSTVHDMLRYAEIYRTGGLVGSERILSAESVKMMTHPHVQVGYGQYYGYGLFVTPDYYGATLLEHSGGIKGVASQMMIIPERGVTGIAMANLAAAPIIPLLHYAVNSLENRSPTASHRAFPDDLSISCEQMNQYVGTYRATVDHNVAITIEHAALTLISRGGEKHFLQPVGDDYFAIKADEEEQVIRFHRDGEGKVKGLSVGVHYFSIVAE